jgi:membrane fusion protein (multidrug efflux system)
MIEAVATAASTGALARRYQALVSDSVVSKQQRDDAVAAWRQAQADVQSARINLQRARLCPDLGPYRPLADHRGRAGDRRSGHCAHDGTQLDPIFVDIQQSSDALLRLRRSLTDKNLTAGKGAISPLN